MRINTLLLTVLLSAVFCSHTSAQLGGSNGKGQWSAVIPLSLVPVAAANLPDGKIVAWSAFDRFAFGGNRGKTYTIIFDPATNSSQELLISDTGHDMFCPGTANLPDGHVMVTGGSSSNKTSLYNPFTGQWTAGTPMNIPRGYHAMVTLANGNVFTIGGSWSGNATQRSNKEAEVYENGSWSLKSGLPGNVLYRAAVPITSHWLKDSHTWLWPAPNGKIFHAGPNNNMHWFDPSGNGSYTSAGTRGTEGFNSYGTTVMYDKGKILKVGGSIVTYDGSRNISTVNKNTYILDINSNQVQVKKVQNLAHKRTMHNSVVLPTGEVLAIGGLGVHKAFSDEDSKLIPELWSPQTEQWRSLAPMQVPRNYHSIALLMLDGRIFAAGGGLCGNCTANHPDAEIYSPSYLFNADGSPATRPVIEDANPNLLTSTTETFKTDGPVSYFSLIRYNSVTHSTNNEQRRIQLPTNSLGNNSYEVDIPDENIVIPGYYMLFAVNANGTPSIAKVIQVFPGEVCDPQTLSQSAFKSYASNQDFGTAQVQNGGKDVYLTNNAWKYIDYEYTLTPNTMLSFEFKSTVEGEIAAIGMDDDNAWSGDRAFMLYGTQTGAGLVEDFNDYEANSYEAYNIPIGQYYTGSMDRLFFLMDHDNGAGNGNAYFRNIKVYEQGVCKEETIQNIAYRKPTTQSSMGWGGVSSRAVDGFANGIYQSGASVTHTLSTTNPWWRVDLGERYDLSRIEVSNRTDCCSDRLVGAKVLVGNIDSNDPADYTEIGTLTGAITQRLSNLTASGRYVMVYIPGANKILSLAEVRVYGSLTPKFSVSLKALLEGPFDENIELMLDDYRSNGLLSLTDPYGLGAKINSNLLGDQGTSSVLDWMRVELRDANDPTVTLAQTAALITREGNLVDIYGNPEISFYNLSASSFYVSLHHYNHLGVMTAQPANLSTNPLVDFSSPLIQVYSIGGAAMRNLNGRMLMWGGDADGNGRIDAVDRNLFWRNQNGQSFIYGSSNADFNLNGLVNALDANFYWKVNNSLIEQLP